jgi:hypothetical protein
MDNEGEHTILAPPEPKDKPGTRPATNWPRVVDQVGHIQRKLAGERAELAQKKGNKV